MTANHSYVALLRGINVGGKNMISMNDLKACFERSGLTDVRSYINSGNILFTSSLTDQRQLEKHINRAIAKDLSLDLLIIVRSQAEIAATIKAFPDSWAKGDQKCNVMFIDHTLDRPDIVDSFTLKPDIDELHYTPGALLWSAKQATLTRSAMLKVASRPEYQHMSLRDPNTVHKILALMQTA